METSTSFIDNIIEEGKEFPFNAVVILSDSLWEDSNGQKEQLYAKMFSQKASVFFVQKYIQGKDNWVEKTSDDHKIIVFNPVLGYSIDSLLNIIRQIKKMYGVQKILFWLYSCRYTDYIKSITFRTSVIFHALHVKKAELGSMRNAFNSAIFIIANSTEIASCINNDHSISTKSYVIIAEPESSVTSLDKIDKFFSNLVSLIWRNKTYNNNHLRDYKKKVLLLYSVASCRVNTIREHVNAFGLFSRHQITYYDASNDNCIHESFLNSFDAVVIHFSVRISVKGHLSEEIYTKLKSYPGAKILFIQDEYDNLAMTYSYMEGIGFDSVFTCVPDQYVDYVYPSTKFKGTRFINNFTGYIPYTLLNYNFPKIADRSTHVFYRGRALPYFYGTLGKEKYEIGIKFKAALQQLGITLNVNLESAEDKRIYGEDWYYALSRSKATLATESGSNVFDFDGDLEQLIESDVQKGKNYDYIYEKYIKEREQHIQMNQVSPKIFEAICLGTVLVLYEGNYSGILTPWVHYIPLKKDFSNFADVIRILQDDIELQKLADKAYEDIIQNGRYTYQTFIRESFDKEIDDQVVIMRDCINSSIKPSSFIGRLNEYFYNRAELSKIMMRSASPSILSETYEFFYIQPIHTVSWRLKDLLYKGLYYFPLSVKYMSKTIGHYTILIFRSFTTRILRVTRKLISK